MKYYKNTTSYYGLSSRIRAESLSQTTDVHLSSLREEKTPSTHPMIFFGWMLHLFHFLWKLQVSMCVYSEEV